MIPAGSTLVESIDTADGAVTTVQNTYQCRNAECDSFTERYIWTYNGESFIMHHLERHLEAA
jgi:DNA polymerase IIIc chi subunit